MHWVIPFDDGLDLARRCHVVLDLKSLDLNFILFAIVGSNFSLSCKLVLNNGSSLLIVKCSDGVLLENSTGTILCLGVLNEVDLEVFAVKTGKV
jgi:hypothetical protein